MKKIWGYKNEGILFKHRSQNLNFLTTHTTYIHKIFRVSKYEKTIKFDKPEGYQIEEVPLKRNRQNLNFLTTYVRQPNFSD